MKKKNLFPAMMATAVLASAVMPTVVGASSTDEIKKYYESTVQPTDAVKSVTEVTPVPTSEELLKQLDSSKTIYDTMAVYDSYANTHTAMLHQAETYTDGLVTNDDELRRKTLEKIMGISLTDINHWGTNEDVRTPTGSLYTKIDELKNQANYAINENRQTLIQYGVKTSNWQPYYWFDALSSPSYYELVNGQLVNNKNYYAMLADTALGGSNERMNTARETNNQEEYKKWKDIFDRELKYYVDKFNTAPGMAVYSLWLHHHTKDRTDVTVTPIDKEFYNSKWNNPVVRTGKSIDGSNPFRIIIKGLQDGSLTGNLVEGYTNAPTTKPVDTTKPATEVKKETPVVPATAKTNQPVAFVASNNAIGPDSDTTKPVKEEQKTSLFDKIILKVKQVSGF